MEIALTYGCPESVDRERLVEYVHHNRNLNARRISTMGEDFFIKAFDKGIEKYPSEQGGQLRGST